MFFNAVNPPGADHIASSESGKLNWKKSISEILLDLDEEFGSLNGVKGRSERADNASLGSAWESSISRGADALGMEK